MKFELNNNDSTNDLTCEPASIRSSRESSVLRKTGKAREASRFLLAVAVVMMTLPLAAQDKSPVNEPLEIVELTSLQDARQIASVVRMLPNEEQARLSRLRQQFAKLPPAEQDRMRELHQRLWTTEDGDRLFGVLERYRGWLSTLSAGQRDDLLSLPFEQRVAEIVELKTEQDAKRFAEQDDGLKRNELAVVVRWIKHYVGLHEEEILQLLPADLRQRIVDENSPQRRWRMLIMAIGKNRLLEQLPPPPEDAFELLFEHLSPKAKERLAAAQDGAARLEIVRHWIEASLRSRHRHFKITEERLNEFYTNGLSPDEQESIDRLPASEMQSALKRLYVERRMKRMTDGPGPPGHGRDGTRRRRFDRPPPRHPPAGPPLVPRDE